MPYFQDGGHRVENLPSHYSHKLFDKLCSWLSFCFVLFSVLFYLFVFLLFRPISCGEVNKPPSVNKHTWAQAYVFYRRGYSWA